MGAHEKFSVWLLLVSIMAFLLVLAEAKVVKDYLSKMRRREPELAKGWGQIVHPLVVRTPGGLQKENFANLEGMFSIIQSIPSKEAEPFKRWLAQIGAERIHQMQDPEQGIQQSWKNQVTFKSLFKTNRPPTCVEGRFSWSIGFHI